MKKPLLIIQPASSFDDLPKLCAQRGDEVRWFTEACQLENHPIISVKVYKDEPLPSPDEVSAAIITGAVDMVSDGYAWIERTAEWIRGAIDVKLPLLGVCFGHQIIAHALGGRVGDNPNGPRFGNVKVSTLPHAKIDALFKKLPETMNVQVFHWQSILSLPTGASVVAVSEHDPYYAVRFSHNAWGVQFHPEMDADMIDHALSIYRCSIEKDGGDVASIKANLSDTRHGSQLLQRFVDLAQLSFPAN